MFLKNQFLLSHLKVLRKLIYKENGIKYVNNKKTVYHNYKLNMDYHKISIKTCRTKSIQNLKLKHLCLKIQDIFYKIIKIQNDLI